MWFKQTFTLLLCLLLAACASTQNRAPVLERSGAYNAKKSVPKQMNKDWRPDFHVVKKGDTLYSIGLEYGYDYKEIAQLNQIEQPYVIRLGQTLKLKDAKTQIKPAASQKPQDDDVIIKPLNNNAPTPTATPASTPTENADLKNNNNRSTNIQNIAFGQQEESTEWIWPTKGKVTNGFIEGGNAKGIDIEGKLGQEINAANAGKVIYNGSDLRGYGNLVIIKHNTDYLSVYAHNHKIFVKEGQQVLKGQKIAEMGSSGADKVKLHFEIRYQGKSVDPAKFLSNPFP
jgi:lipoprotein NlpD